MVDQRDAWDDFYRTNRRAWRGMNDLSGAMFPAGCRVLEIGCGNGKTAAALAEMGYDVTGLDFSLPAIELCREFIPGSEFICADVRHMPFPDSSFDGIVSFHVLGHLTSEGLAYAVSEMDRVLRPGSYVFLREFAVGDMRSEKGETVSYNTVVRGNGILYHYFDVEELCRSFSDFETVRIATVDERTRFGETRSRIEAVFRSRL